MINKGKASYHQYTYSPEALNQADEAVVSQGMPVKKASRILSPLHIPPCMAELMGKLIENN